MKLKDRIALILMHKRIGFNIASSITNLQATEFAPRQLLNRIQQEKFSRLIDFAAKSVPYWSERVPSNFRGANRGDIRSLLSHFGILRKEDVRNRESVMRSRLVSEHQVATTGGTTGAPLKIYRDWDCVRVSLAALWRSRLSWGLRPSDRAVYLHSFGIPSLRGRIRMRLANKWISEAFPSSVVATQAHVGLFKEVQPHYIEGFATGLLRFAEQSEAAGLPLRCVVSTGEILYPHQRRYLEEAWECNVYTYYGSNEVNSIAFECEFHNLHVCEEHVVVEVVNDSGTPVWDEIGRVVVTDLDNRAMPWIRYELGDEGELTNERCRCGRHSSWFRMLAGRTQDYLSGQSGNRVQATFISGALKDLKEVGRIQFIQLSTNEIRLLFEGNVEASANELDYIEKLLKDKLGSDVRLERCGVVSIPPTLGGKFPLVLRK